MWIWIGIWIQLAVGLLLYGLSAAEIAGRVKLNTATKYFTTPANFLECTMLCIGLVLLLYDAAVRPAWWSEVLPLLVIIGKNCWEYYLILKEEKELKQTKARASEEVAFDKLDDPGQIEMETVVKAESNNAH